MRHNDARKWLHAGLDLLPLILIPVFMIYSHRHDLSTDINIQQDVYKDFYQEINNGKPNSVEYWTDTNDSLSYYNGKLIYDNGGEVDIANTYNFNFNTNDLMYFKFNIEIDYIGVLDSEIYLGNYPEDTWVTYSLPTDLTQNQVITLSGFFDNYGNNNVSGSFWLWFSDVNEVYFNDFQVFNLTKIFGSGNEPTKDVFESYLTQDYYEFGSNQVKVGTIDVPAKNNDIMSVFMDSFNNSINKYFNMGNVFGMTNVYQWFNTNIFGGKAPTIIFSVWNIVLYEFVMDLLFLLYGLFMWFIDMCKHLMEKPFRSIK